MDKYKVLVVDDEEEIREGVIRKMDWEALGFVVVGSAENGLEALDMVERCQPDVIMTDIKMPFMDGLELIEQVMKDHPAMKVIVFSGYDDFEYAKRAIKFHVVEYILKPVSAKEMAETLTGLKEQMDQELADRRDKELLQAHYKQSLPVIREQFLMGIAEGKATENDIRKQGGQYGLHMNACYYMAFILRAESRADASGEFNMSGEEALLPVFVKRIADEFLAGFSQFVSFLYGEQVAVIADFDHENAYATLISCLNEIHNIARHALNVYVYVGAGTVYGRIEDMKHSFREAKVALNYAGIIDEEPVVYYRDIEKQNDRALIFGEAEERILHNAVKLGCQDEINTELEKIFAALLDCRLPAQRYQTYFMEMFTSLLRIIHNYGLDQDEIFGRDMNYIHLLTEGSLVNIKNWVQTSCLKIRQMISGERVHSSRLLVERAKELIEENYANNELSVEVLCDHLHVSPAYFSTVFKRETGENFISYLTNKRLQKAVELLKSTDEKTYIIAQQVGYAEPNYFSYVFKKKLGISPSKYRNS